MYRIINIETKLVITLFILLIILNLISLYFIIDLFSYDEIIGYLSNGDEKHSEPRKMSLLFFITSVSNLLFASISLMSRLIAK